MMPQGESRRALGSVVHWSVAGQARGPFLPRFKAGAFWPCSVTIWDMATGAQLSAWFGDTLGRFHESSRPLAIYGVGWSPDVARLASTRYDGLLQFWDTRTGRNLAALPTSDKPNALTWSPDGRRVATGNDDGGAQIWNVATLTAERDLLARPLAGWAYAVHWSSDGTLLAI